MKKKQVVFIVALFTMLFSIAFIGKPVHSEAATRTLEANEWYTFKLNDDQKDDLIYKMPSKGYCYFQVVPLEDWDDGFLQSCANLKAETVVNYKTYESDSVCSDDGIYSTQKYAFNKGTAIHLKVNGSNWSPGCEEVYKYKVRVVQKNPSNFESENNNSKKKADALKAGKTTIGLKMSGDTDWFVFKAPKTGKYTIKGVVVTDDGSSNYMNMYVYKGAKNIGSQYIYYGSGWGTAFSGKLKKGQKIYLKINHSWSYDYFYKIKVSKAK